MFNVLFIVLLATTTFSVKSMEVEKPKKEKLQKTKSFKKSATSLFAKTTSTKNHCIATPTIQPEHPFVIAAAENNEPIIKDYLSNPYFNPNIFKHKNALSSCIENKHYDIAFLLLHDHRLNTSIDKFSIHQKSTVTNNDLFYNKAENCISLVKKERMRIKSQEMDEKAIQLVAKLYELQLKLFARQTLDLNTNAICADLKKLYPEGILTNDIMSAIMIIKKRIERAHSDQTKKTNSNETISEDKEQNKADSDQVEKTNSNEMISENKEQNKTDSDPTQKTNSNEMISEDTEQDREIPTTGNFPDYATDEFMIKKIQFILSLNDSEQFK